MVCTDAWNDPAVAPIFTVGKLNSSHDNLLAYNHETQQLEVEPRLNPDNLT